MSSRVVGRRRLQHISVTAAQQPPLVSRKRGRDESLEGDALAEVTNGQGHMRAAARRRVGLLEAPRAVSATARKISEALQQLAAQAAPVKALQPRFALPALPPPERLTLPPAAPSRTLMHAAVAAEVHPGREQLADAPQGQQTVRFTETAGAVALAVRAAPKHNHGSNGLSPPEHPQFRFSPPTAIRDALGHAPSAQMGVNKGPTLAGEARHEPVVKQALNRTKPANEILNSKGLPKEFGARADGGTSAWHLPPQLSEKSPSKAGASTLVSSAARQEREAAKEAPLASKRARHAGNPAKLLMQMAESNAEAEVGLPVVALTVPPAATSEPVAHTDAGDPKGKGAEMPWDTSARSERVQPSEELPKLTAGAREAGARVTSKASTGGDESVGAKASKGSEASAPVANSWGADFLASNKLDASAAQAAVAEGVPTLLLLCFNRRSDLFF
jgi:hypothetical protein